MKRDKIHTSYYPIKQFTEGSQGTFEKVFVYLTSQAGLNEPATKQFIEGKQGAFFAVLTSQAGLGHYTPSTKQFINKANMEPFERVLVYLTIQASSNARVTPTLPLNQVIKSKHGIF